MVFAGHVLECSLAKPQVDQKAGVSSSQKPTLLPSYPSHIGYGLASMYPALGAGYAAPGLAQVSLLSVFGILLYHSSFIFPVGEADIAHTQ